ncbi:MAG: helix-turn-helix domain-containing protein [Bacillota bacterium]
MRQEIGKRVKFLRQKKGYSQEEYAKLIGQSKAYICKIEAGKSKSIYFHILEELVQEGLFAPELASGSDKERDFRTDRIWRQYRALAATDKDAADYLLTCFENGLHLHLAKNKSGKLKLGEL